MKQTTRPYPLGLTATPPVSGEELGDTSPETGEVPAGRRGMMGQSEPTKGERKMKKKLAEAIKGMQVESWEVRERSNGTRKVYVRFTQKEPVVTVDVNQSED